MSSDGYENPAGNRRVFVLSVRSARRAPVTSMRRHVAMSRHGSPRGTETVASATSNRRCRIGRSRPSRLVRLVRSGGSGGAGEIAGDRPVRRRLPFATIGQRRIRHAVGFWGAVQHRDWVGTSGGGGSPIPVGGSDSNRTPISACPALKAPPNALLSCIEADPQLFGLRPVSRRPSFGATSGSGR